MFILLVLNFTLATISLATWIACTAINIRSFLVENVGMELIEKVAVTDAATATPTLIQVFCAPITVL